MMSNNKILTVSYGTFSCTLEGFEDSFGAMKAITEYFRDLSVANPYFGSEPLQPDADMLARIAGNEISRAVQAEQTDTGIHLRAGGAGPDTDVATTLPVASSTSVASKPGTAAAASVAAVAAAPVAAAIVAAQTNADPVTPVEDLARQAVADSAAAEPAQEPVADAPADDVTEDIVEEAADGTTDFEMADTPVAELEHLAKLEAAGADEEPLTAQPQAEPVTQTEIPADMDADPDQMPEPDVQPEPEDVARVDATPDTPDTQAHEDEDSLIAAVMQAPEAAAPVAAEPVEAPIADVLQDAAEDVAEVEAEDEDEDDDYLDAILDDSIADSVDVEDISEFMDTADDAEDTSDTDAFADILAADTPAEPEPSVAPAPARSSIADKLQRIRQVVAQNQAGAEDYSEDEHAEQAAQPEPAPAPQKAAKAQAQPVAEDDDIDFAALADTLEAEDAAPVAPSADAILEDEAETEQFDISLDEDPDDVASVLSRLSDEISAEIDTEDMPEADPAPVAKPDSAAEGYDDDIEAMLQDSALLDEPEPQPAPKQAAKATPAPQAPAQTATPSDTGAEDAPVRPKRVARVLKVKRADLEAAIDSGVLEELDDGGVTESSLSDEDEAELMRELEAVEAEMADGYDDVYDDYEDDDLDPAPAPVQKRVLDDISGSDNEALDRLMAEADSQMDEPESSNRRNAFDRLRAAVAATKADGQLGDEDDQPREDAYRTDLEAAVRPRRPTAGADDDAPRAKRPETNRAAPLKLVAEQRVDNNSAKRGPVRPRRIAAAELAPAHNPVTDADVESFADYATDRGAVELGDVLEAAAAYLSFVEGHEQFSRPQLMTKVRQMQIDGFSREDGLRHFGQLLRAGKIEKIQGGRFTVSDDIGFRPDSQRQAG